MGVRSQMTSGTAFRYDPYGEAPYTIVKTDRTRQPSLRFDPVAKPQVKPQPAIRHLPPTLAPQMLDAPAPSYVRRPASPPAMPQADIAAAMSSALHKNLRGAVSFVPYPTTTFNIPAPACHKSDMARVFMGQLPYDVTDMQLAWLCYTFGNGSFVYFPERITRHNPEQRGDKIPTGCVHAYVDHSQVDALFAGMHRRLLIDDSGVWYAETEAQQLVLERYCDALKSDRRHRASRRPHSTVVTQLAHSTFVPRPPSYGTLFPRAGQRSTSATGSSDDGQQ